MNANMPAVVNKEEFEERILANTVGHEKESLLNFYTLSNSEYTLRENISNDEEESIKEIIKSTGYSRFFSLFEGSIIPNNWLPILFVVAAGLTGYIYSFGFFKLSKFAAHFWVPYTNIYLAILPFIMILFGREVTVYQIIGAVITTAGLMIGVMDYSRNKVVEIEKKNKQV
ncbi:MAG: hypothetical protein M5T52_17500 [Ignavibacteriaceae bacterium]|nr:hypothetical protein [Ignavibacteriaceae bacterium]